MTQLTNSHANNETRNLSQFWVSVENDTDFEEDEIHTDVDVLTPDEIKGLIGNYLGLKIYH